MEDADPLPIKAQLSRIVDDLEDWQARLVLSFTRTVFDLTPKQHPRKNE